MADRTPANLLMRLAIASVIMVVAYSLFASSTTLWDRDEPRFARSSVEMLRSGDWIVPRLNGELRLHKPAGIYWLMASSVGALGVNELAVRLPSIIAMVGLCWLTFLIGRRMFGEQVGYWAFFIQATSALSIYMGCAAMTDAWLVLCMTAGMYVFIERVYGQEKWWHWLVLIAALGFGQLVKGPVSLLCVLSMVVTAMIGHRAISLPRSWWIGLGLSVLAGIGIFLAWGIPANIATDGEFYREGFGKHVLSRATSAMEGHGGGNVLEYIALLPIYVPVILGLFFPWTIHLPGAVRAMLGKRLGDAKGRAVLWGWIGTTLVVMSLVATKLPHYVLPIWPALAIACAAMIEARRAMGELPSRTEPAEPLGPKDRDWLRGGVWFFGPVAVGGVAASAAMWWLVRDSWLGLLAPLGLLVVLYGVARSQLVERVADSSKLLLLSTAIIVLIASLTLVPGIDRRIKSSKAAATAARSALQPGDPVYWAGFDEPSMLFYLDRPVDQPVQSFGSDQAMLDWARGQKPGVLITTRAELHRWAAKYGELPFKVIFESGAVNYASGGEVVGLRVVVPVGTTNAASF